LDRVKIKEIMTKQVITVTPNHTIEEAAKLMYEWRIGGLPVLEDGKLVGIITESDIFKIFLEVMGWGEQGSRLEILVEDKPGALAKISNVIKEFNVNIISVVTAKADEAGKRILIMRIKTDNPGPIINEIQSRGYQVLSAIKG
ncbi:MAG: CBS domain-containing protein, partial [Candidatus Aenigmatarchaeota archaeon]